MSDKQTGTYISMILSQSRFGCFEFGGGRNHHSSAERENGKGSRPN